MKTYKLPKENFAKFVNILREKGKLYGPVKKKNRHSFELIDSYDDLDIDYQRTVLGVKKFVTPPKYDTYKYDKDGNKDIIPDEKDKNIVLGVHPCDIHAIKILDKLFLGNIKDPYYEKRRKNLIIIGHSCLPDDKCICNHTNTDMVEDGFDLFFTELSDFYLVWVGSNEGLMLTIAAEDLLEEDISPSEIKEYIQWHKDREGMFKQEFPFKYMADIIELNYDHEAWNEFGDKCLSCSTCSLVCPTCNCFNVDDKILMNGNEGVRERTLDACTLPYYSMVAGDHNFREKRVQRLKLYYTHKLKEFIGKYGQPSCVGCGRCVTYCPVDINVLTVSQKLYEEVLK